MQGQPKPPFISCFQLLASARRLLTSTSSDKSHLDDDSWSLYNTVFSL